MIIYSGDEIRITRQNNDFDHREAYFRTVFRVGKL